MLKEMVNLIAVAQESWGHAENGEAENIDAARLAAIIGSAKDAIGRYDEQKRKTDEAICLLFRAFHEVREDADEAMKYIDRAERLLGFASLEPAKG